MGSQLANGFKPFQKRLSFKSQRRVSKPLCVARNNREDEYALLCRTVCPRDNCIAEPVNAQQVKAGVLTCDVSEGMGYIIGSQKLLSCSFNPDGEGRRESYDGSITKFGLDLGLTRSSRMAWVVFTNTVAGPGFLSGDYFGASGEATVGAGLGANVLLGGSNRTVTLQPLSLSGQTGLNVAVGVAALQLGLPRQ